VNDTLKTGAGLVIITMLVLACYSQTLYHQVVWDALVIFSQPELQSLSWENIQWMFSNSFLSSWDPLSWVSHAIDFTLYGQNPGGHHATNILLHLGNTFLVFQIVRRFCEISQSRVNVTLFALTVAALFALHPLRVESVAWIAARKELLYTFFYLLSILLYLRYISGGRLLHLGIVCLSFACATMAKSMAVTLPAVLLLLDFYPLQRFRLSPQGLKQIPGLIIEKIPMFLVCVITIVITLNVREQAMLTQLSHWQQFASATHNITGYILEFVLPFNLSPYNPLASAEQILSSVYWGPPLLISLAVTAISFVLAMRGAPIYLVCWLSYVVMILPASGFIQIGTAAHADRYTYLPMLPINLLAVAGLFWVYGSFPKLRRLVPMLTCVWLLVLTLLCFVQTSHWNNRLTLWARVLDVYPNTAFAQRNIALAYFDLGANDEAMKHLGKMVEDDENGALELERLKARLEQQGLE